MLMKVGGRGLDANKLIGAQRWASSHSDFLSSARVPAGTSTPAQPLPRTPSPPVDQDVLPRQEEHSPDNGESAPAPAASVPLAHGGSGLACTLNGRPSGPCP